MLIYLILFKKKTSPLIWSDYSGALDRFDLLFF